MMKLPCILTAVLCLFLVLCIVQGLCWPLKPVPGWSPEWWQSLHLAKVGYVLFAIPGLLSGPFEAHISETAGWIAAIAVAAIEIALLCLLFFVLVHWYLDWKFG
jgi:hypothetical protein